jgi:hypothetical protein
MVDPADLLRWGLWRRLATASRDIRRFERDHLDYIGQTGTGTMTLRQRLGRLREKRGKGIGEDRAMDEQHGLTRPSHVVL